MNIYKRAIAPTPGFFKTLRVIGLVLSVFGGGLIGGHTQGNQQPSGLIAIAKYLVAVGAAVSAVSQLTVDHDPKRDASLAPTEGQ